MDTWHNVSHASKLKKKGKKRIKRKKGKSKGEGKEETGVSVRRRDRERKGKRGFSLLSKIYGNRAVGFRRSKKKS